MTAREVVATSMCAVLSLVVVAALVELARWASDEPGVYRSRRWWLLAARWLGFRR